ncbi:MAG: hypothetical protein A2Z34_02895 [Planctomycetes bacterium RBG_16_59_8]|nr:MAG: hypothetical protein A2Z34_02895 [Planctomycetes bacterium RBG_16_59_8]
MGTSFAQKCVDCGHAVGEVFQKKCPKCRGPVEFEHDLSAFRLRSDPNPHRRFFDLLPYNDPEQIVWLGDGNTPCFRAEGLGRRLGLTQCYLKDETKNPTRTTKDRMASAVLSNFRRLGITEFLTCSTGNSSTSLARGVIDHPEFRMHLYVADGFLDRMNFADAPNVSVYLLEGASFAAAFNQGQRHCEKSGMVFEAGFFNPARRAGLKMAFLEAVEQTKISFDWYVQAVSSGMGVFGTYKAATELKGVGMIDRLPKLCCVQQESCAPMVRAYEEGSPDIKPHHIVRQPSGIARDILRGDPSLVYPSMARIVRESGGAFVSVAEADIRRMRSLVLETESLDIGFTAAATVVAVERLASSGRIAPNERVLVNISGGDRVNPVVPSKVRRLAKIGQDIWESP